MDILYYVLLHISFLEREGEQNIFLPQILGAGDPFKRLHLNFSCLCAGLHINFTRRKGMSLLFFCVWAWSVWRFILDGLVTMTLPTFLKPEKVWNVGMTKQQANLCKSRLPTHRSPTSYQAFHWLRVWNILVPDLSTLGLFYSLTQHMKLVLTVELFLSSPQKTLSQMLYPCSLGLNFP